MTFDFAHLAPAVAGVLAALTLPGTLLLALLSVAGLHGRPTPRRAPAKGRIAIVVPAHNEAQGIERTVRNLLAEVRRDKASDVVVIADNCSDDTAAVAQRCGARVLERSDEQHRGKGFALDFAFRSLLADDYQFFVVIDADSEVAPGFLNVFRRCFAQGSMALQARYTVLNAGTSVRTRLMELALCAFNVLRPRGRAALGWSAGILGNGFGLRRAVIERVPYTAGSVVEDLEYHLVLIWHGVRVDFADQALVRGEMPSSGSGVRTQRTRWEGGRLRMLVEHAPGLVRDVCFGQHTALEPLLDLLLLPLSYHVALLALLLATPLPWAQALAIGSLAVVAFHVVAAARVGGVPIRNLAAILYVPFYIAWKILLLPVTLAKAGRESPWLRTARETARHEVQP
jgi:cellulose synthase/poly-beta-1,6-N-acetylglucosamine synthase-like glycosyltransferase